MNWSYKILPYILPLWAGGWWLHQDKDKGTREGRIEVNIKEFGQGDEVSKAAVASKAAVINIGAPAGWKGRAKVGEDGRGRARSVGNNGGDNSSDIVGEDGSGALLSEDDATLKATTSLKYPEGSNSSDEDVGGADCGRDLGGEKNLSRALKSIKWSTTGDIEQD